MPFQIAERLIICTAVLPCLLYSALACGSPTADPAREFTRGAFAPADLLWYDGTEVGQPLLAKTEKQIASIRASSTLASKNSDRYAAKRAIDRDSATAWCEGADGDGAGQSITIRFTEGPVPAALAIVPGYAKNETVWNNNPRVARFRVEFLHSAQAIAEYKSAGEELYPREYFGELRKEKKNAAIPFARPQYFDFRPDFTQDMGMLDFDGVRIEILSLESRSAATGGSAKYSDACISELRFFDWD
ncbi:MAG: hypothetical protein NXI24_10475 [bacterium]|nr:hypothetical protein [bacterium]